MKYRFFKDRVGRTWALPPLEGTWGGKKLVAGLRDDKGNYRFAVADDGSGIVSGGTSQYGASYFTPLAELERPVSTFKGTPDPHRLTGFRGEVYLFVDPSGVVHAFEACWGSILGTELLATCFGMGSAYHVGVDGRVFCDGGQMYGPGYFTRIEEEEPPRSPPRLRDVVLDLLVTENPKKLDVPTREAYEDYVCPLLKACYDTRNQHGVTEAVWRAGKDFGVSYNGQVLERIGTKMKGIVRAIDRFLPPEWARDFQEITDRVLEVSRFAGSGNLLEGGYVVFRRPDQTYYLEHTHGPARGDDVDLVPWDLFEVHVCDVPKNVYSEFDWVNEKRKARRKAGVDKDPLVRAEEVALIGDEQDWANLDSYPLRLTGWELRKRWEDEDWEDEVADSGRNYRSNLESKDLDTLPAVLYELLTLAERNKINFDEALATARKLRRATKDADAREQDVSFVARQIAEALTKAKVSVYSNTPTLFVRADPDQVERVVYDPETQTWAVKKYF
jgi:hypothetical protein